VIDVEQRPLRALEQNVAAALHLVVHEARRIGQVDAQSLAVAEIFLDGGVERRQLAAVRLEPVAHLVELMLEQRAQPRRALQVGHAHAATGDLGFVRRADAALGGAERRLAGFAQPIDLAMQRQDHVRVGGDDEVTLVGEQAALLQRAQLLEQRLGIDHHAVAEDAALAAAAQDARRDEPRHQLLPVDDERVARVGATAEAHHHVGELGVQVDDLALAFVAPLGADNHYVGHAAGKSTPSSAVRH
jgi:hypothetical protein